MSREKVHLLFSAATGALPEKERYEVMAFTREVAQSIKDHAEFVSKPLLKKLEERPELLDTDARVIESIEDQNSSGKREQIPLAQYAVLQRRPKWLTPLIKAGCDIDACSNLQRNALSCAVVYGGYEIVEAVSEHRPNLNIEARKSTNPQTRAMPLIDLLFDSNVEHWGKLFMYEGAPRFNQSKPPSERIPRKHDTFEALFNPLDSQSLMAWAKILIQQGANPNKPLHTGELPIHKALMAFELGAGRRGSEVPIDMAVLGADLSEICPIDSSSFGYSETKVHADVLNTMYANASVDWEDWNKNRNPESIDNHLLLCFANLGKHREVFGMTSVWNRPEAAQHGLDVIKTLPPYLQSDLQIAVNKLEGVLEAAENKRSGSSWQR